VQIADERGHGFSLRVDFVDPNHAVIHIFLPVEHLAERLGDGVRLKPGGGHLIQQRPEAIVILLIEKHYLHVGIAQAFG